MFKNNSLKDIKKDWDKRNAIVSGKRTKVSRLIEMEGGVGVGKVKVLRENNYDLDGGEPSVFGKGCELEHIPISTFQNPKQSRLIAGKNYENMDHCQACGETGSLVCCDLCPMAYHAECLGFKNTHAFQRSLEFAYIKQWQCPHHICSMCSKPSSRCGNLLMRCYGCPNAYCEDCVDFDGEIEILDDQPPPLLKQFGFHICNSAIYCFCTADCKRVAEETEKAYTLSSSSPQNISEDGESPVKRQKKGKK